MKLKLVLVKHMGHDGPWLLFKTPQEIRRRRAFIKTNKPAHEVATRLRLLKIVKQPLPPPLAKADAAWTKTYAAWRKADAAWTKASAAWTKASAAWTKADEAWTKADEAWTKAYAACTKPNEAWTKADAAWRKAINSKAGVAFHKKICGCGWTPEQPDILRAEGVNP